MSKQSQNTCLKIWYKNFIKLFRSEFSKSSNEEKKHISYMYNYRSPCQIEVFWLKQPEWQLIVETHFKNRPDGEIIINGPYDTSVFQDEVKSIFKQPRWNIPIDENSSEFTYYRDRIAETLHRFVEMAKNALFSDCKEGNGMTISFIGKNEIITHFYGNRCNYDYRVWVQDIINKTKQQLEDSKTHPVPKESFPEIEHPKGFATYFFPPIIIDENLKRTVDEILQGVTTIHISPFDKKIFDIMIDGILVLVEKDGFVSICSDNKTKSLDILNTLMMISSLNDLDSHIVRKHELSEIEYNPETNDIVSRVCDCGPLRNQLFGGIPYKTSEYETRYVNTENIKKIFEKTSTIFKDNDLSKDLRSLLEIKTHMKDSEFSQALIMGWKIIEKYISQKWRKKHGILNEKAKHPTTYVMITDLKVELQEYFSDFTELRKIRNNSMHNGRDVTEQEAQKCVNISNKLVLKNSNNLYLF